MHFCIKCENQMEPLNVISHKWKFGIFLNSFFFTKRRMKNNVFLQCQRN